MAQDTKKPSGGLVIVCCALLVFIIFHWTTASGEDPTGLITVPMFFILSPIAAILVYRYFAGKK